MSDIVLNPKIAGSMDKLVIFGILGLIIGIVGLIYTIMSAIVISFGLFGYILLYPLYLKKTEYIIKSGKVVKNRNLGGEVHEEVQYNKIQNTTLKQSFLHKIMGDYGTISISTAGSDFNALKLSSIENATEIHRKIADRVEESNRDNELSDKNSDEMYEEYKKLRETTDKLKQQMTCDKI